MTRKFQVGDRVIFSPINIGGVLRSSAGTYLVLPQLPPEHDLQPQYYIEHVGDGHIRVASEREPSDAKAWP
jgi:hypothetical protein